MPHVPVTSSVLASSYLATYLSGQYAWKAVTTCRILRAGINDTYLVENGGRKFVFRVYSLQWRTVNEIQEEVRLLLYLNENGISVSYPLPDRSGQFIQTLNAPEGERFAVLFTFAEGEKLHSLPAEAHQSIGSMLGKMHLLTENFELKRDTYTAPVLLIDSLNQLSRFLPEKAAEMKFMRQAQAYLLTEFEKVKLGDIRKGAVHLDIWFDNLNMDEQGSITFFDFDFCGNGWLCMDVAYYILQLYSTEKDETERTEKLAGFLAGYESQVPLTEEEKRLIPMLGVSLYFYYLGVQSQRFENYSNVFLSENYLKRFIQVLVKAYFDRHGLGTDPLV